VAASTVVAVLDPFADFDPSAPLRGPHAPVAKLSIEGAKKDSAMALSQPVRTIDPAANDCSERTSLFE